MIDLKQTKPGVGLPNPLTYSHAIIQSPKPVGYWVLYPQGAMRTMLGMYHKPTDEQIKNTEQLLGWQWRDA